MFEEFRVSMDLLAQALTAKFDRGEVALANQIGGMVATRVRDLLRMNPL